MVAIRIIAIMAALLGLSACAATAGIGAIGPIGSTVGTVAAEPTAVCAGIIEQNAAQIGTLKQMLNGVPPPAP